MSRRCRRQGHSCHIASKRPLLPGGSCVQCNATLIVRRKMQDAAEASAKTSSDSPRHWLHGPLPTLHHRSYNYLYIPRRMSAKCDARRQTLVTVEQTFRASRLREEHIDRTDVRPTTCQHAISTCDTRTTLLAGPLCPGLIWSGSLTSRNDSDGSACDRRHGP